jgi:predicted NBD/HSP70 family sugar kinase
MVPRWTSGYDVIDEQEAEFVHAGARNPGSIEALASVGAINARCRPYTFDDLKQNPNHLMWQREAYYLAHMLWNLTCIVSPHAIVMGGRVMSVPGLIDRIRAAFSKIAGDASFPHYGELANPETYITICANPQGAEIGKPGVIGALCLAAMEAESLE